MPLFFTRGAGSGLMDVGGNDYVIGQGPNIFGHTPVWLNAGDDRATASHWAEPLRQVVGLPSPPS